MATTTAPPPPGDRIIDEPLTEALSRRYLAYALSVITDRALPDVRDGLKPVQRRVLYAMREMRLNPENAARKCAKVVGEVMGGYHPHGDQSIYDTLVRMAQAFAQRYPLVDGQGNFGNIDGDNAAAMRYTEAKLTVAAMMLLDGIDEDAVDFRPTYDGSDDEPTVLPAGFPNLLANGSTGIAVGMATSIPPHNAGELIDACLQLLDKPDASVEALMAHVQGPDFPTGGVIVEARASMLETYATGRGGIRVRAKWEKEDLGKGMYQIVVTEMPYQVKKADLVERLAELIDAKKAPLLGDVRDESAEDVRLVLEPKSRNVEAEVLMESLFKLSDLETRFSVNLNVLDARGTPGVMNLKQALAAFLDHRRDVLVRRARHRLGKIEARLHILDGLMIAYLNLDEVIRIVRYEEEPKARLIETFTLSDIQADAILNTRLRQLARLEEMELRREHAELSEERDGIVAMLADDRAQWKLVGAGLREVKKALGVLNIRRSLFADAPEIDTEAALEAMIVREPITIILSERGWIRAAKGRVEDPSELKFKEGDKLQFLVPAETTDKLLIFASDGRFFTLACDKLPGGADRCVRAQTGCPPRDRLEGRLRLHPARSRGRGLPSRGQAGAERHGPDLRGRGCRRSPGRGRRQRQTAGLPDQRTARNATRQGRQTPELPRRRPARRHGLRRRRGRILDHLGRPHAGLARMARMAGAPGISGQAGPEGVPGDQAVPAALIGGAQPSKISSSLPDLVG